MRSSAFGQHSSRSSRRLRCARVTQTPFPLYIRVPAWATKATIDGKVAVATAPSTLPGLPLVHNAKCSGDPGVDARSKRGGWWQAAVPGWAKQTCTGTATFTLALSPEITIEVRTRILSLYATTPDTARYSCLY